MKKTKQKVYIEGLGYFCLSGVDLYANFIAITTGRNLDKGFGIHVRYLTLSLQIICGDKTTRITR